MRIDDEKIKAGDLGKLHIGFFGYTSVNAGPFEYFPANTWVVYLGDSLVTNRGFMMLRCLTPCGVFYISEEGFFGG